MQSVVRSSCQNADVEKHGEGLHQQILSACLVVWNAEVGSVDMMRTREDIGDARLQLVV